MPEVVDQYSTAKPLFGQLSSWVADPFEQRRLAAYDLYEAIYWGYPGTFKLTARGTEDKPIYIPSGRVIVETMHRYLANDARFVVDPAFGTDSDKQLAQQVLNDLMVRERLLAKFNANKRFGIMRGDWFFHLYADPNLPPGSKISVMEVDPSSVFKIHNEDNLDQVIGYHIAESFTSEEDGKVYVRRLTYRKQTGTGGPSPIVVTDELYKPDDWGGPGMDPETPPEQVLQPEQVLPSPIDDLPIYHIPNFMEPGSPWGSSEMRGLERIMGAINQTISDEDLALALEGLGVYTTDAGTPVDDDGREVPWAIAPGKVIELPDGRTMDRLQGITSIQANQDHLQFLLNSMQETLGMSDVARGRVDVQMAESGIAMVIELSPLLARAGESEQTVTDVMTQLLFNLPKWFVAYEGGAFNSLMEVTRWVPKWGQKIPRNADAELKNLLSVAQASPAIVPASYIRTKLREIPPFEDLPDEATVVAALAAQTQAEADALDARISTELDSTGDLQQQQ